MQDIDLFDEIGKTQLDYLKLVDKEIDSLIMTIPDEQFKAFFDAIYHYACKGKDTDLPENLARQKQHFFEVIWYSKRKSVTNTENGKQPKRKRKKPDDTAADDNTDNDISDDETEDANLFDATEDEPSVEDPPFSMTKQEFSDLFHDMVKKDVLSRVQSAPAYISALYEQINGKKEVAGAWNWSYLGTYFTCSDDVRDYIVSIQKEAPRFTNTVERITQERSEITSDDCYEVVHMAYWLGYAFFDGIKYADEYYQPIRNRALLFAELFAEWYIEIAPDINEIFSDPKPFCEWLYNKYSNAPIDSEFAQTTKEAIVKAHERYTAP